MKARHRSRKRSRARRILDTAVKIGVIFILIILVVTAVIFVNQWIGSKKTAQEPETVKTEPAAENFSRVESPSSPAAEERTTEPEAPELSEPMELSEPSELSETAEPETASVEIPEEETAEADDFLPNFDEYHPGDIIDKDRIDRNDLSKYFVVYQISREGRVYSRINGKSFVEGTGIPLESLRYIQLPHWNFNGEVQLGEIIVNERIADAVVRIFREFFLTGYQIEKMRLVDDYWTGDGLTSDSASMKDNNTYSFCYRKAADSDGLSKHAYGLAIDVNPQQNPYVVYTDGIPIWEHSNSDAYIDRNAELPHMIDHDDAAYLLFTREGFVWGGDWNVQKDYQHFDMR